MNHNEFSVLDEYELMEFFSSEPIEKSVGYFCYEVTRNGHTLRFSCDVLEKTIQTALICRGVQTMVTYYEGDFDIKIYDETLTCIFVDRLKETVLTITLKENIDVKWITVPNRSEY